MEKKEVGIIGSGGQALEVVEYLRHHDITPAFFAVNEEYVDGKPDRINVADPSEYEQMIPIIAAIGAPEIRKKLVEQWKGEEFATVVSTEAYLGESVEIGEGSIVGPRAVLTDDVLIGKHNIINVSTSISHGCRLGDYVTVSPGAHVAGDVLIGDGVFIGIGAIVSNGITIAKGSVIGAGAVLIESVYEENSVMVGNPARLLRVNEGWLNEV
jgi:sugar O-acyltransferase (sialic acid O-acetyltransferase NeuD family)